MADYWDEYVWIVVVGCLMSFFMAYGIGANDVANAFATSVGSKTLTLVQATILAGIFEFSGALLLGRGVTDTVRKGIIDRSLFEDAPEVLMFGMLCALTAAGIWLIVATYFELPVSTTHSIIGGIVGFGLVARGSKSVIWHKIDTSNAFPVKGISSVVISWVFSPVASGLVAAFFFIIVRTLILRSDDSFNRTFMFLPVLVGICIFINAFYVLDKGIAKQWGDLTTSKSAWIAAIVAAISIVITAGIAIVLKKRAIEANARADQLAKDIEDGTATATKKEEPTSFFGKLSNQINHGDDLNNLDAGTQDIHDNAENFEEKTENVFRILQVLTSCCDSFAHGANDVANAIGPFSAIWAIYRAGAIEKKSEIPVWILVIGGAGIVFGLATYGYTIIKAIGVKLTKITPSRGFCIELGSALVVVTGSYLGLPLSTTHCQVGATVAVGLVEGAKGVSWVIVGKSIVGWVFTLIIVGLLSAVLMALGIFSPNIRDLDTTLDNKAIIEERNLASIARFEEACPDNQAFLDELAATRGVTIGSLGDNTRYPQDIPVSLTYLTLLETDLTTITCPAGNNFVKIDPVLVEKYPVVEEEEE